MEPKRRKLRDNRAGGGDAVLPPGLLSDSPLALEPGLDEALLSAGLPPASGERPQGFPGDYSAAHTLGEEDYDWFLHLTGDISRDLRRQVFHTRLYTTADLREHILSALLISAAILLWKGTVSHRMVRRDVRRAVGVMGWLIVAGCCCACSNISCRRMEPCAGCAGMVTISSSWLCLPRCFI